MIVKITEDKPMNNKTKKRIWFLSCAVFFALAAYAVFGADGIIQGCVLYYQTASNQTINKSWQIMASNEPTMTIFSGIANARIELTDAYCYGNQKYDSNLVRYVLNIVTVGLLFISALEVYDAITATDQPQKAEFDKIEKWLEKHRWKPKEENNGDGKTDSSGKGEV